MELKEIFDKLVDDVVEKMDYGDLEYNDYKDYSVNFWLEKSERAKILENFRINMIKLVDEQVNNIPIPKIVINLKSETTEEETLRIAENLQNFMEKEEYGKLLEVEIK